MLSKGSGAGRGGRRGRTERGGFISYAQLGISQLGAVYEGLMSYTGFIADEDLYEVAKNGDPSGGSWMIPASKVPDYADEVFVKVKDENGFQTEERVRYLPGSFVYRLAGRDRQTSASYYTPQSLTSVTVQLALEQRVKEQGGTATAAEVLRWRVCEPALGSGAFLNEAIDQLAALYLRLREEETGDRLEPEDRALAMQRVKAYIALHNCYGVDLNETAVELAEVSIWLNVMHRGLQAPWFGLHLVRGNSLIGAGRRLYPAHALTKGEWLDTAPEDHPFSAGKIPSGHVHHFLLPAVGWGAVAGEKEAKELAPDQAKQLATWRRQIRKAPSERKSKGHKLTQVQRLQALSARAEYLWSLVIERLRISEREISRPINVWGATDLPRAQEAIPRDEIVADLTTPGTPYWRLKTVMDAWCALWFWPLDKAALLDGSAEVYKTASPATTPQPEPAPVDPDPNFPVIWEMDSLFGETPRQMTLAEAAPKKPRPKPTVVHRSPVPLANLDDWLDFAEALLGRQDVAADSLASDFDVPVRNGGVRGQAGVRLLHGHGPGIAPGRTLPLARHGGEDRGRSGLLPLGTPLRHQSSPTAASTSKSATRRGCGPSGMRIRCPSGTTSLGSSSPRSRQHQSAARVRPNCCRDRCRKTWFSTNSTAQAGFSDSWISRNVSAARGRARLL